MREIVLPERSAEYKLAHNFVLFEIAGERPYVCDYPGCGKSFCQSGQLNTSLQFKLAHNFVLFEIAGERPYVCD